MRLSQALLESEPERRLRAAGVPGPTIAHIKGRAEDDADGSDTSLLRCGYSIFCQPRRTTYTPSGDTSYGVFCPHSQASSTVCGSLVACEDVSKPNLLVRCTKVPLETVDVYALSDAVMHSTS